MKTVIYPDRGGVIGEEVNLIESTVRVVARRELRECREPDAAYVIGNALLGEQRAGEVVRGHDR